MSKWFVFIALAFTVSSQNVFAEEYKEKWAGAYLCTDKASGGVWYDEVLKKWRGVNFNAKGSYLFNLKRFSRFPATETKNGKTLYSLSITAIGEQNAKDCEDLPYIEDGDTFHIQCSTFGEIYVINFETLRYSSFYRFGYTNGQNNNENTPSVTVGECAKVQ